MHLTQRCQAQCVHTFDADAARLAAIVQRQLRNMVSTFDVTKKMSQTRGKFGSVRRPKNSLMLNCTDLSGASVVQEDIVSLDVEVRDLGILWQQKKQNILIWQMMQMRLWRHRNNSASSAST